MKTLVTGGAGFIGGHLIEALLKDDHDVIVLDHFPHGKKGALNHIKKTNALKLREVDINDFGAIEPYFKNIDWVFHLAGKGGIKESQEKSREYYHVHVMGTINVLEASRMANVKRFIYANSDSCYGIPHIFPTPETAQICPRHPYGLSKHIGEMSALSWDMTFGLPVLSLRLFKVYGPRLPLSGEKGGIVGSFLEKKLTGQPLLISGDGKQTRDFIFVSDVVRALLLAARSNIRGESINIGSGTASSINSLAKLIGGPIDYTPDRLDELTRTQADITKARKLLGWEPKVSLEDGVKKLLSEVLQ